MAVDPNEPWGWVPPEWHQPPVAPADEWNDGGGPAANAELAAANLAAMRAQAQAAADKTLGTAGGLSFGEGMTQEQLDALNGPSPERDLKQLNRQRGIVSDAAHNALGTGGGYAFDEGMSKELMNAVAGEPPRGPMLASAPRGRAYIAQSTGPIGTIGTMGHDPTVAAAGMPLGDMSHLSADLAAATPPPLEVDAISGGALPGQQVAEEQTAKTGKVTAGQTAGVPSMPEGYLSDAELGAKWSDTLTDDEKIQKELEIEGGREQLRQAGTIEAGSRALRQAQDNARALEQSMRESHEAMSLINADAQKLAQEKIDPLQDISTGQKVAGVLAAFIGGFGANKTGRNFGLEAVDSMIDNAIKVQTANLNNRRDALGMRRNAIAEQMALGKDLYHAQETVRLAAYDSAIKDVETKAQQYDPRGTQALKAMKARDGLLAQRAALLVKLQAEDQKRREANIKLALDAARVDEDIRKNKANEKLEGWRIGETAKHNRATEKNDEGQLDIEAKKLIAAGNKDAAAQLLERGIGGSPVLGTDENGKPRVDYKLLQNADGTPFIAPTKEEAQLFRKKKAAVDTITNLMGETFKLVQQNGYEPDFLQSPAWQKAKANWATIMVKQKDFQDLGAITESDAKLIQGLMGAKDPTQMRSPLAGMEKAFDNTVAQFNSDMRSIGYTGADYAPMKSWQQGAPEETKEDRAFKVSLQKPGFMDAAVSIAKTKTPLEHYEAADALEKSGMTKDQLATVAALAATATDTTKSQAERDAAIAKLNEGAKTGQSQEIRDEYTRVLSGALSSSIPAGSD